MVVRDLEQPRAQRDLAALAWQRSQRAEHRALQRILGIVGIAEDRAAVTVEVLVVAVENRSERGRIAVRCSGRDPLLAARPEPLPGAAVRDPGRLVHQRHY